MLEADRNKFINIYNVDVTHQYNKEALCTQQQETTPLAHVSNTWQAGNETRANTRP